VKSSGVTSCPCWIPFWWITINHLEHKQTQQRASRSLINKLCSTNIEARFFILFLRNCVPAVIWLQRKLGTSLPRNSNWATRQHNKQNRMSLQTTKQYSKSLTHLVSKCSHQNGLVQACATPSLYDTQNLARTLVHSRYNQTTCLFCTYNLS
jgi:hypothetical protein